MSGFGFLRKGFPFSHDTFQGLVLDVRSRNVIV